MMSQILAVAVSDKLGAINPISPRAKLNAIALQGVPESDLDVSKSVGGMVRAKDRRKEKNRYQ